MKEKLYTIPLNDAVDALDECPFCYIERKVEQDLMDFVLGSGSSYMESDVRSKTDSAGFCRMHFKKMFDYGNTLGNGWILKTHLQKFNARIASELKSGIGSKSSFTGKLFKGNEGPKSPLTSFLRQYEDSCFICTQYEETYERYLDTFLILFQTDPDFKEKIKTSKGFCVPHFADLCEYASKKLNDKERREFEELIFPLMEKNLERLQGDVNWLIEKFDYRNKDADWKNSKDAIQRTMQKLKGGYPSDPPYKSAK